MSIRNLLFVASAMFFVRFVLSPSFENQIISTFSSENLFRKLLSNLARNPRWPCHNEKKQTKSVVFCSMIAFCTLGFLQKNLENQV